MYSVLTRYFSINVQQGDAKKFKAERETNLTWFGDMRPIVDDEYIVQQLASFLEKPEIQDHFIGGHEY